MKKLILGFLALFCFMSVTAEAAQERKKSEYKKIERHYRYRVSFTDKKDNGFSVKHPEAFLSEKSVTRRKRLGLKVDNYDLPITPAYLHTLQNMGMTVFNQSKWNNTAVVELVDTTVLKQVRQLPFVKGLRCVWVGPDSVSVNENIQVEDRRAIVTDLCDTTDHYYGHAARQVEMLGVDKLHKAGFTGKNVTIGVIDGGFFNADAIAGLKNIRILGTKNFAHPGTDVYSELDHGMMVLSCMAANRPYFLVGTAPDASFCLLQSEAGETEQLIEEDNWCAALEYADSLGCDMVTSSLGYTTFDHSEMSHKYYEADGRTALNSRSASLAASRGIVLLNSAGNSGDESWKKIGFPADATDILTVGAVTCDKVNTDFSSIGNTADGRIKPDVMAMGYACAVYGVHGGLHKVNGTSFSCPIMCGAVACLLQAYPTRKPVEIIQAVQQASDNVSHPDNIFGYGIPDMNKAFELLK